MRAGGRESERCECGAEMENDERALNGGTSQRIRYRYTGQLRGDRETVRLWALALSVQYTVQCYKTTERERGRCDRHTD